MSKRKCSEEEEGRWIVVICLEQAMTTYDLGVGGALETSLNDPENDSPKWDWKAKAYHKPWIEIDDLAQFTRDHVCIVRIREIK